MRPGEIFLSRFPFGDMPGMKLCPVLLLTAPSGLSGGPGRRHLIGDSLTTAPL